jgi:translation elongation factor EF-G
MTGSIPTLAPGLKVAFLGKDSSKIASDFQLVPSLLEEADAAIFVVSAITGVADADKDQWVQARELYIPSIILITDFESGEIDFDDMAAIAGRILDPVVTPYLVLHGDDGSPVALIELETLKLYDYSHGSREIKPSEPEHQELVKEFASEFAEKIDEFGPTGFQDALLFPAIPYLSKLNMGKIETLEYLAQLPARS